MKTHHGTSTLYEPMLTSHNLLLKYRHDARYDFHRITVWYVDRGADRDRSSAEGEKITALTDQYFEIATPSGSKCIPYHRLRKITYNGLAVWDHAGGNPAAEPV